MPLPRVFLLAGLLGAALLAFALIQRARSADEGRAASAAGPIAGAVAVDLALATDLQPAAPAVEDAGPAETAAANPLPVPPALQEVDVAPVRDPPRLEVWVVDRLGRPAAGVQVSVWRPGPGKRIDPSQPPDVRMATGGDGIAGISLQPGFCRVSIEPERGALGPELATIGTSGTTRVDFMLLELSLDLLPMPENSILGMVVDADDKPVGGARVSSKKGSKELNYSHSESSGLFLISAYEPRDELVLQASHGQYDPSPEVRARGGDGSVVLRLGAKVSVSLHMVGPDGGLYDGPATVFSEHSGEFPGRDVQGPDAEIFFFAADEYRLRVRADPLYLSAAFTARRGDVLEVQLETAGTLAASPELALPTGPILVRGEGGYEQRLLPENLRAGTAVPPGLVEVELPGGERRTLRIAAGERATMD